MKQQVDKSERKYKKIIQKPSFSVPNAHTTISTSRTEAFSSQEGNMYQTVHAMINNKRTLSPVLKLLELQV